MNIINEEKLNLFYQSTSSENSLFKIMVFKIMVFKIMVFKIMALKIMAFKIMVFKIMAFKIVAFHIEITNLNVISMMKNQIWNEYYCNINKKHRNINIGKI